MLIHWSANQVYCAVASSSLSDYGSSCWSGDKVCCCDVTCDTACRARNYVSGNMEGQNTICTGTCDAGAGTVHFVVDGVACDGGGVATRGWAWLPTNLTHVAGSGSFQVGPDYGASIVQGELFSRRLYVSEVVGLYRYLLASQ